MTVPTPARSTARKQKPAKPKRRFPPEVLTDVEVRALIDACPSTSVTGLRNRALLAILYRTGLRISEALDLYPKDVDLERGAIRVLHGKGDKARVVGVDRGALAVLARWHDVRACCGHGATRTIFCTSSGQRLTTGYVRRWLPELGRRAGLAKRVHAHGLRHTLAAQLREEGVDSRELSTKVFKGQCRLIELGFRQGGPAGFGLRRMLVNQAGESKTQLQCGEQKSLQTDRVILVPGPEEEICIVRQIYEKFTRDGLNEGRIAAWLNADEVRHPEYERQWSVAMVHQILTNEKYIGNNIYNRVSFKLKKKRVRNAPSMWVRRDRAFEPIIDPAVFFTARGIILERSRRYSDEELLGMLRSLLSSKGTLSSELIDDADGIPSSSAFKYRFGSLIDAYRRVGYVPSRDYRFLEINRHLRTMRPEIVADVIAKLEALGATVSRDDDRCRLLINGEYSAAIVLTRCRQSAAGTLRWLINLDQDTVPDITVVVRMDASNQNATDFYILPRIDVSTPELRLGESNGAEVDTYRYDTLGFFIGMAARSRIEDAA